MRGSIAWIMPLSADWNEIDLTDQDNTVRCFSLAEPLQSQLFRCALEPGHRGPKA